MPRSSWRLIKHVLDAWCYALLIHVNLYLFNMPSSLSRSFDGNSLCVCVILNNEEGSRSGTPHSYLSLSLSFSCLFLNYFFLKQSSDILLLISTYLSLNVNLWGVQITSWHENNLIKTFSLKRQLPLPKNRKCGSRFSVKSEIETLIFRLRRLHVKIQCLNINICESRQAKFIFFLFWIVLTCNNSFFAE
jgi:hypothetical protein